MSFFSGLFGKKPYPADRAGEVERMVEELIKIGKREDFLSERPGGVFNAQSRHIRAREIGTRLHDIGGIELMEFVQGRVKKKLGANAADHLAYAWSDIGRWIA